MQEKKKKEELGESLLPPRPKKNVQKKDSSAEKPKKESVKKAKGKKEEDTKAKKEKREINEDSLIYQLVPYLYVFAAFLLILCLIFPQGMKFLGEFGNFLRGLFSYSVWLIPLFLINQAVFWKIDAPKRNVKYKFLFSLVCLLFANVLVQMFFVSDTSFNISEMYKLGIEYKSGGVVGGILGNALFSFAGYGTIAICVFIILIFGLFLFGATPMDALVYTKDFIAKKLYEARENSKAKSLPVAEKAAEDYDTSSQPPVTIGRAEKEVKPVPLPDYEIDADEEENIEDEISEKLDSIYTEEKILPDAQAYEEAKNGDIDLKQIFTDDAVIEGSGITEKTEETEKAEVEEVPAEEISEFEVEAGKLIVDTKPTFEELYKFPGVDLLTKNEQLSESDRGEMEETAAKIVSTLADFGVKVKISNVSHGPTVTRYELVPEVGVRIRAIQSLTNEIAMRTSAESLRIEAPIPGKNAVGIEIPNTERETVYIRDLIDNSEFYNLKSRISFCLGKDVAGNPVYLDMAKMPHLLIAGATGMGKSVCINTFITSILYKARPDEVKMILIDPKKVELNIYNGIPHLLVPTVSDPKKAAGALAWAVNEMERRFMLIEEVGVRDLMSYNKAVANDPEKEKLPQILIIIDELADLMMTAKDDVETSICRLAQKARAAGMHLVIGTQRPSVDVITGLIKANVPSRISFRVSSQVDSRTVIDIAGAEKLMTKGDMLFAPAGSTKPLRVQGAFVSDGEVDAVTSYLKQSGVAYDEAVMNGIEVEAQKCGEKKKSRVAEDGEEGADSFADSDPMIMRAIEVAVDSGVLSTSLLQRRLSLGYARAARIVDTLETMGIVGPFEGAKPRKVLISKEQYFEMKLRNDENQ